MLIACRLMKRRSPRAVLPENGKRHGQRRRRGYGQCKGPLFRPRNPHRGGRVWRMGGVWRHPPGSVLPARQRRGDQHQSFAPDPGPAHSGSIPPRPVGGSPALGAYTSGRTPPRRQVPRNAQTNMKLVGAAMKSSHLKEETVDQTRTMGTDANGCKCPKVLAGHNYPGNRI